MEGIELPYNSTRFGRDASSKPLPPYADNDMFGVVEWICITNSDQSAKIPEIKRIIESKWTNLGFPIFFNYFLIWSVIAVLVTVLVVYDDNMPDPHPKRFAQWLVTIIYPIVLALIVAMNLIEIPGMLCYGFEYWGITGRRIRGAAKMNKILSAMATILFVMICFYKLFQYQDMKHFSPPVDYGNSTNTTNTTSMSSMSYDTYHDHISRFARAIPINTQNDGESGSYDPMLDSQYYLPIKRCEVILVIVVWIKLYYFFMGFDSTGK